jgi:hypothetical protein
MLAQLLFHVAADDRVVLHNDYLVNRHVIESSRRALAAVEFCDVVRALPLDRGQLPRRNHAAPQQALLVLAVKQNEFHGHILVSAQEWTDFRMPRAFVGT